jgi:uncharacterized phiE125 gp8 family phage protein
MSIRPTPIVVTPPSVEPLTLAEAKAHCAVSSTFIGDDALLTGMIAAARRQAEHKTGTAIIRQELELTLDAFPPDSLSLQRGPALTVTWVKYYDASGVEQTLSPSAYTLDAAVQPGFLLPAYNTEWPDTLDSANAVRVRYYSGMAEDSTGVPEDLRSWMLLMVGAYYRNREAFAQGVTVAELPGRFVESLLDPYTRVTI